MAPVVYITGMLVLLYMGSLRLNVVVITGRVSGKAPPGSVYRSNLVFEKLRPFMEAANNGTSSNALMHVWDPKVRQGWKPCIDENITHPGLSFNTLHVIDSKFG